MYVSYHTLMYYLFTKFHDKLSSIFELACYIKWNKYIYVYDTCDRFWAKTPPTMHKNVCPPYTIYKSVKISKIFFIFCLAIRIRYEWIASKRGNCRFYKHTYAHTEQELAMTSPLNEYMISKISSKSVSTWIRYEIYLFAFLPLSFSPRVHSTWET